MRTIPLGGKKAAGRVALIDDEDFGLIAPYAWCVNEHVCDARRLASRRRCGPYAVARIPGGGGRLVMMHKLITGWPETDHEDHDGLNNQRSNLRQVSHSLNLANQRAQIGCASPYKGVCLDRRSGRWYAQITTNGKTRSLGQFAHEIDAARAYDAAALAAWGEYAWLNFPLTPGSDAR